MIRVIVVLALSLAFAPSAQAILIQGDTKLGSFEVKRDGTLRGAIEAFGRPTSLRRSGLTCHARWSRLRLHISFYNPADETRACRSPATSGSRRSSAGGGRRGAGFGSATQCERSGRCTRKLGRIRRTGGSSSDGRHSGSAERTQACPRRCRKAGWWRS